MFHAETSAIAKAAKLEVDTWGSSLYLTGHDYCCDNCLDAMRSVGIRYAKCLDSGKVYNL